jgi:hypothetical protein
LNKIEITPTLFVTPDVWYNKGKLFRNKLPKFKKDVAKIENELGLKGHKFILCAIRHKATLGSTVPNLYESKIDPRRKSYDELLGTILHEGIHLQQAILGKLVWNRYETQYFWNGKPAGKPISKGKIEFAAYKQLPWEIEAWSLTPKIFEKLFNKSFPTQKEKIL